MLPQELRDLQKCLVLLRKYSYKDSSFLKIWNFQKQLETNLLLKLYPNMTIAKSAFICFCKQKNSQLYYLLRWNKHWNSFNLVAGKYESQDGNLKNTIIREIKEELNLDYEKEYRIHAEKQIEFVQYSTREKVYKQYLAKIFFSSVVELPYQSAKDLYWANIDEIATQSSIKGDLISYTTYDVLLMTKEWLLSSFSVPTLALENQGPGLYN